MKEKQLTRRGFMGTAAGVAAFTIVPRSVLGGAGQTPPSEKLNIAGIGVGGRGAGDMEALESQNIVALCDVDWRNARGTFKKYPNAKQYKDFRVMLDKEDKNIDAVMVATADHCHAPASMAAMKRGKHVYCEKPLTHTVYEARLMAETARQYKVATQMGNQGQAGRRGPPPVRDDLGRRDRPGARGTRLDRPADQRDERRLLAAGCGPAGGDAAVPETLDWDLWLGPAPQRPYNPAYLPFKWRGWWDFGTGALGDIGCHSHRSRLPGAEARAPDQRGIVLHAGQQRDATPWRRA